MSERIWDGMRKNALYKSTYTLLYFNGSLPPGGWLIVTCGLTAGISSGPNVWQRVWEAFTSYLLLQLYVLHLLLCITLPVNENWRKETTRFPFHFHFTTSRLSFHFRHSICAKNPFTHWRHTVLYTGGRHNARHLLVLCAKNGPLTYKLFPTPLTFCISINVPDKYHGIAPTRLVSSDLDVYW